MNEMMKDEYIPPEYLVCWESMRHLQNEVFEKNEKV